MLAVRGRPNYVDSFRNGSSSPWLESQLNVQTAHTSFVKRFTRAQVKRLIQSPSELFSSVCSISTREIIKGNPH